MTRQKIDRRKLHTIYRKDRIDCYGFDDLGKEVFIATIKLEEVELKTTHILYSEWPASRIFSTKLIDNVYHQLIDSKFVYTRKNVGQKRDDKRISTTYKTLGNAYDSIDQAFETYKQDVIDLVNELNNQKEEYIKCLLKN